MADVSTEIALATTTLGTAAASITFSSISAAYTDLRIVLTGTDSNGQFVNVTFNSDTAANYSFTQINGSGSAATSSRGTSTANIQLASNASTTVPSFRSIDIFSYAGSTYKTALATDNIDVNGSGLVRCTVGLWRSTSAITSVTMTSLSSTFIIGTTATLYGIKAA